MKRPLYQVLARAVQARQTCGEDHPWFARHQERVELLVRNHLPSGAGWDCGTRLDWDRSTGEKLIFYGSFHHMDEHGGYDGWTDHEIWVRPSLGFDIRVDVKGRNRNDIKDYLGEMFYNDLRAEVDEWEGVRDGEV